MNSEICKSFICKSCNWGEIYVWRFL